MMKSAVWSVLNLIPILFGFTVCLQKETYEKYKLYEVTPKSESESLALYKYSELKPNVDFVNLVRYPNTPVQVIVAPEDQKNFEEFLKENNIAATVKYADISKRIRAEQRLSPRNVFYTKSITFDRYYSYNEIDSYLDYLAGIYPQRVKVQTHGLSYENKPIKSITISNGIVADNKKTILIDAGIHSREWMAPATALYIIYKLVEEFEHNKDLLNIYDWTIIPIVNPDGYEYSHQKDRLWRKTRKPNFSDSRDTITCGRVYDKCTNAFINLGRKAFSMGPAKIIYGFGTDGNRNFDSQWGGVGSSSNPCHRTYQGPHAFSEPETQAIRNIMHTLSKKTQMYLTLHSYGAMILYPWGYKKDPPANWEDMDKVANAASNAIEKFSKRKYRVGTIYSALYKTTGSSVDYALEVVGIPFSFAMELPPGIFHPNPSEIKDLVEESWIGIKTMAKKVQEMRSSKKEYST